MVRIIRWVSKKTGKKWIHPIEEGLEEGDTIEKVVSKKAKVIGITKVHIPNPMHPIVPYNVIILEDEHGHRQPKKVMADYTIGDAYEDKPCSDENAIAAIKIKYDFTEAIDEALELIGDVDVKGKRILIKPNASIPMYAYLGTSTNPKAVEGLIEALKRRGAKTSDMAIAEQSFFMPIEKAVAKSGIPQICKKHGIEMIDIAKTEFETKQVREFTFEVSKIRDEYDVIINMPVIKTDMVLGMDGAFENLTRFLSKKTFDVLAKDPKIAALAISVLPKLFKEFITIGDASIGQQGNGPMQYGEPGFFNVIFAAKNPVVHDTAVAEVLCLRKLPYVELSGKMGMGEYDIKNIQFVGNELDALRRDIKQPIGSKLIKG